MLPEAAQMLYPHPTPLPEHLISCILHNIRPNEPLCSPELREPLEQRNGSQGNGRAQMCRCLGQKHGYNSNLGLGTGSESWVRVDPSACGIGCSLQVPSIRIQLANTKLVSVFCNWLLLARASLTPLGVSAPVLVM